LVIDLQYLRNDAQSDTIFPALGNRPAPIALHRSFQEANDPRDWPGNFNLGYDLTHRFNQNWSLISRFLLSKGSMKKLNVFATALDDATGVLDRTTQFQKLMSTTYATNLDLKGKFDALGAKHQVLVGVDYLHDTYDCSCAEGLSNFPINIFNPVYGSIPGSAYDEALNGTGVRAFSSSLVKQAGVYVQDQITLFDKLHVLLGGRYDHAEVGQGNSDVSREEAITDRHGRSVRTDGQFSPRVGLLYQWTPRLSTYGSYSKSFGANNGRSSTGEPLPPERGEQFEVGTKAELFQGLSATVALRLYREFGVYQYQVETNREIDDRPRRYTTQVFFDANTGALRLALLPSGQYTGNTLSNWLYALHMANVFGLPYRIFVCGLGLVIVMLSMTGVYVWLKKRRSKVAAHARGLDRWLFRRCEMAGFSFRYGLPRSRRPPDCLSSHEGSPPSWDVGRRQSAERRARGVTGVPT
jgi:outer membrane receptor protein involved in Fe transport